MAKRKNVINFSSNPNAKPKMVKLKPSKPLA